MSEQWPTTTTPRCAIPGGGEPGLHICQGSKVRQMDDALFVPNGEAWLPTSASRGPWSPDALHGGPVAALLARAVEQCDEPGAGAPAAAMSVVRLTVELLRPVPLAPLDVQAHVTRPGRKVQIVDVRLGSEGRDLAWARAVRIRRLDPSDPEATAFDRHRPERDASVLPDPALGVPGPTILDTYPAFHNGGAELRFVTGSFDTPGPCTVWTRLLLPIVPGEEPSPVQRAAAGADFGNGVSAVLPFDRWRFVNPDLTVVLERPPAGQWIALQAVTDLGEPGIAVARSVLWDVSGPCGTATQTLLVETR